MRFLIFFMLFATIFTFGCGEDVEEEMKEDMVVETQTPLEKAQEAMQRVNDRRTEEYQKAEEAGDFSVLFTVSIKILQEELGFNEELWEALLDTWEDAHNELVQGLFAAGKEDESKAEAQKYTDFLSFYFQKIDFENMSGGEFFLENMSAYDEIVTEYLRLSYEFPDATQERLLALLKEAMVDGKVSIQYPEGL